MLIRGNWILYVLLGWEPFRIAGRLYGASIDNQRIDVFFCVSLNKLLNQQSFRRWFETPWRPCDTVMIVIQLAVHILCIHDGVIKWKHFPRYWRLVREIHRSPLNSPHKGRWPGALMFSLIWAWINGWVNNGEAGDLRRHRGHYDVILMMCISDIPANSYCFIVCLLE